MISKITEDKREIQKIWYGESSFSSIGYEGITKIIAYDEYGQGSFTPWLAVYQQDQILCRVPAHMVVITYVTDFDEDSLPF